MKFFGFSGFYDKIMTIISPFSFHFRFYFHAIIVITRHKHVIFPPFKHGCAYLLLLLLLV